MARVLAVGIATLDIINSIDGYPGEDAEVRAVAQRICRGGNATNTLAVLAQFGHHCSWAGVLADEPDGQRIKDDLKQYQIDTSNCRVISDGKIPTSYITHNTCNGSRTIIHYRDLPEFNFDDFARIDLSQFDWAHFEGRNVTEAEKMLAHVAENYPTLSCSLEIEKPRPEIEVLYKFVDILIFSKNFLINQQVDFVPPGKFIDQLHQQYPEKQIFCAWGEDGAYGIGADGIVHHAAAQPPPTVIDTLGAGDTFNAAIIDSLIKGLDLKETLAQGCRIAGRKCGHIGLKFIN